MVQSQAHPFHNQKESDAGSGAYADMDGEPKMIAATRRVIAALDRLEHNLQHIGMVSRQDGSQEEQLSFFANENAALKQERESLNTAIAQLREQYDALHHVAGLIYGKLDNSIKKLTRIIES